MKNKLIVLQQMHVLLIVTVRKELAVTSSSQYQSALMKPSQLVVGLVVDYRLALLGHLYLVQFLLEVIAVTV